MLCAPAGITAENLVMPVVWRVSQPSHVHMSGQCGDSRLTWHGAHATGEGPLPAPGNRCFSSLRGKWQGGGSLSALPTTPVFISVFQWASRSADSLFIFSVCWEVHGVGVSKDFTASQQALNILVYTPTCNLSFFMMAVSCLQCLLSTWVT